jgi:zinc protease
VSRNAVVTTRRCWRLAALAALVSLGAGCAATATTASGGGQSRPPAVEVLPNGLTLIMQEHRAGDIVAVHLWVATGVRYEGTATLGHAHFQEHMLFKGTDTFSAGHVDRTVEGTGGRSNAFTAADYTTFQVLVPSEAIPTAIGLLDDMAFRSKFDPKEIDSERQVIFEEARIETDTPKTAIVRQLYSLVFADHPYGRPVLGTPATMNAATQDNLKAFNHRFYTPENMALVVIGPIDARAVRAMVDRTFGRRPRTGYTPPAVPSLTPLTAVVRRTVERPEQQAHLAMAWQAPSLADRDSLPLDLLATILGGSESSRFATMLRDREGIVSRVTMSNATLQLAGILYVQAQLEAGDVEKVEVRILDEIARLQQEGPTEAERELAVTKAESEHAFAYETSDGVATAYGTARTSATLDDELRYIERLRTITREQIRDAARKYLSATAYVRLAFVPRKAP